MFAAAGYLVVMPNPRGSTGYGQKFVDEVSGDWGGKAYDDLMAVVDKVAALPYADPERMVAAGGSYGGYMVDWLLGHSTRFKAFVSHAGVFDPRSMAAETEELPVGTIPQPSPARPGMVAGVTLGELYTDNLMLATDGQAKQSSWITQVQPFFRSLGLRQSQLVCLERRL